jgi:hypothetical protein
MMAPAPRKSRALKKAWFIRWKNPKEYADKSHENVM